jgi:hypothetical protein
MIQFSSVWRKWTFKGHIEVSKIIHAVTIHSAMVGVIGLIGLWLQR